VQHEIPKAAVSYRSALTALSAFSGCQGVKQDSRAGSGQFSDHLVAERVDIVTAQVVTYNEGYVIASEHIDGPVAEVVVSERREQHHGGCIPDIRASYRNDCTHQLTIGQLQNHLELELRSTQHQVGNISFAG
jgi:hypothetical protein